MDMGLHQGYTRHVNREYTNLLINVANTHTALLENISSCALIIEANRSSSKCHAQPILTARPALPWQPSCIRPSLKRALSSKSQLGEELEPGTAPRIGGSSAQASIREGSRGKGSALCMHLCHAADDAADEWQLLHSATGLKRG